MRPNPLRLLLPPLGVAVVASLGTPGAASAQSDFLFRPPVVSFGVRAGPMLYSANSDVFDDVTTNLTLQRGDFRAPALGAELVVMPSSRLDVALGVMWAETNQRSEFRDWTEPGDRNGVPVDLPITQMTRLRTIPLTASLRYLILPRGRRISALAWLPRTFVPFVGAGGGVTWYHLQQDGDFVALADVTDEDIQSCRASGVNCPAIFTDVLETSGKQVTFHALAGVEYWLMPRVGLNAEARYTRGSAQPNQSFSSYNDLDLSGLQLTLGLSFRW